jgi:hypothetical protein
MEETTLPESEPAADKAAPAAQPNSPERRGKAAETRSFGAAERQAEAGVRAAQDAARTTAEARERMARANGELLRRNIEAAEDVMQASVEVGLEGLSRTMSLAFRVVSPDGQLAARSALNARAISEAGVSLARAPQEASRAWFDLVKQSFRTNLEAMTELSRCRSAPDVFALQTRLLRENFRLAVVAGQAMADVSIRAIGEADRAIRSAADAHAPEEPG